MLFFFIRGRIKGDRACNSKTAEFERGLMDECAKNRNFYFQHFTQIHIHPPTFELCSSFIRGRIKGDRACNSKTAEFERGLMDECAKNRNFYFQHFTQIHIHPPTFELCSSFIRGRIKGDRACNSKTAEFERGLMDECAKNRNFYFQHFTQIHIHPPTFELFSFFLRGRIKGDRACNSKTAEFERGLMDECAKNRNFYFQHFTQIHIHPPTFELCSSFIRGRIKGDRACNSKTAVFERGRMDDCAKNRNFYFQHFIQIHIHPPTFELCSSFIRGRIKGDRACNSKTAEFERGRMDDCAKNRNFYFQHFTQIHIHPPTFELCSSFIRGRIKGDRACNSKTAEFKCGRMNVHNVLKIYFQHFMQIHIFIRPHLNYALLLYEDA